MRLGLYVGLALAAAAFAATLVAVAVGNALAAWTFGSMAVMVALITAPFVAIGRRRRMR